MKEVREQYDVGVIVGRFQVPELHEAHEELIRHVCEAHSKVIIFLGLSPLMVTRNNPLDFESRKQMILAKFPDVNVLYAKDQYSDRVWSKKLDEQIGDLVTPSQSVVLYGSRDSFIARYHGKYPCLELEQETFISGNEIRREVSRKSAKASADYRAGVVWAAYSTFPTVYTCVDVAVFNEDGSKLLLGQKPHEDKWRLIGGFADPKSESFEHDARREVAEEAHVEISDPEYIGSFNVDDWRYRGEIDSIRTLLFRAKLVFGEPRPDDDIEKLKWFDTAELRPCIGVDGKTVTGLDQVMPNHRLLVAKALLTR